MAGHFYVTTPIYYVNDAPHIGHAYTTVVADVLARYHRLRGTPTHFLTGTDEHGQKVQRAAEQAGISPQEQADRTVVRFQALWRALGITHDDFIRTTEPRHEQVVRRILQTLYDRGHIYRADYDGGYCVPCERFHAGRDLEGGVCRECGRPLEPLVESNYFFRMSAFQDWLVEYIRAHPRFILPAFRRNETLGFLRQPLNDLCISRPKARLHWGIELPFDADYVTYVWIDALLNYISAIGYPDDEAAFRRWWPVSCQLIGKDILTTHTVYWPTLLKALDLPMPDTILAHGWWLVGEHKMSKSAGNVVDPLSFAERYGPDAFRYFLMAEMTMGQDCAFTEEAFVRRVNADLANDLGNLASRVLKLVGTHCQGRVPAPGPESGDAERILVEAVRDAVRAMDQSVDALRVDQGLAAVGAAMREANRYLEKRQPWTLAKQPDRAPLGAVLYHALETLRILSGLLHPVMPSKMAELRLALGLGTDAPRLADLADWGRSLPGTATLPLRPLFPRLAPPGSAPESRAPPAAPVADPRPAAAGEGLIDVGTFAAADLRTAVVRAAEPVPNSRNLLRLQVQLGPNTRQIVAGIANHYEPARLIGRTVVVVANLKPAVIRGVESHGMLLAASAGDQLRLVTLDGELPPGSKVK